jgi:predicted permease
LPICIAVEWRDYTRIGVDPAARRGTIQAMITNVAGDLRLAVRNVRTTPVVMLVAVLSLAVGIGASTAMFSVFNAMSLRTLPVNDPQRLVTVTSSTALGLGFRAGGGWSYPMWERFRDGAVAFDGAFAWTMQRLDSAQSGVMQPIDVLVASGDMFATLGVRAAIGRTFTAADDVRGGGADGAVAVISHDFWQRQFNGAATILGTRVLVEGTPVAIIGVTPPGFFGVDVGQGFDVAIPFGVESLIRGPRALVNNARVLLLTVMLRLRPQQSIEAAAATLRTMQPGIIGPDAPQFLSDPFVLVSAATGISDRNGLRQRFERPVLTLAAVCTLVLLIVCLNIANVLLARATARRAELSVRLALGASRSHLVRQLFVESLVLATSGAAIGVLFASWASRVLVARLPMAVTPALLDVSTDWSVLGFTTFVTIAATAVCGTVPAWHATRVKPIESLQEAGRMASGARQPLTSALIVAQMAVSIVLLVAAGLFAGSAVRLARVPLGFDADRVLVMTVNTARAAIDPGARLDFYQRIVDAVAAVPGIERVAGSQWTPLSGGGGVLSDASGRRAESARQVAFNFVTPGWFATYGTPIRAGRDIDARDTARAPRVALINEALARELFLQRDPLGQTVEAGPCNREAACVVIGVVGDALYGRSLRDTAPATVYVPLAQSAGRVPPNATLRLSVRTVGDPTTAVAGVANALRTQDSALAFSVRPLSADLEASFAQERLVAILASFFGGVAALLAALGLYGVTAYAVARRHVEIGIRLALGAAPREAVSLMIRRVGAPVVVGTLLGVTASIWLSRFVAPLLYGLAPGDPATLAGAVLALIMVATIAAWIPASRASRLDPAAVLREQ